MGRKSGKESTRKLDQGSRSLFESTPERDLSLCSPSLNFSDGPKGSSRPLADLNSFPRGPALSPGLSFTVLESSKDAARKSGAHLHHYTTTTHHMVWVCLVNSPKTRALGVLLDCDAMMRARAI
jgi:hypothetical protein